MTKIFSESPTTWSLVRKYPQSRFFLILQNSLFKKKLSINAKLKVFHLVLVWKSSQYLQTHICASIPKCWYYGRFYLPTRSFFFIGPNFMDEWTKRLFSLRPTTYLTGIHNRYIKSFFTRMIHFTVKCYDLKWFFYKFQHPSRSSIVDIIKKYKKGMVWFGFAGPGFWDPVMGYPL